MSLSIGQFVIAWLEAKGGPAEYHGVAKAWNWDSGVEPLSWILDQADCDLSTGLEIFWLGEGFSELDPKASAQGQDREASRLMRKAIERIPHLPGGRFRSRPPDYAREWIDKGINWDEATRHKIEPFMVEIEADERYPVYSEGVPAEARIAYFEAIGEAVPEWLRQDMAAELANENLNETEEEMQRRFRAARKEDLRDWIEVFAEVEKLKKKGAP